MIAKILSVSPPNEKGKLTIVIEFDTRMQGEKRTYTVSQSDYEKIGRPEVGADIMDEEMAVLNASVERTEAVARAVKILSCGENNRAMLYRKLREHDHTEEAAKYAVERMVTRGYIKERDQIERLATGYAQNKLWGRQKIYYHLLSKGYTSNDIEEVLGGLVSRGNIDFNANLERLIRESLGSTATQQDIAELKYKYGYNE